jgi:hypothetical protein
MFVVYVAFVFPDVVYAHGKCRTKQSRYSTRNNEKIYSTNVSICTGTILEKQKWHIIPTI